MIDIYLAMTNSDSEQWTHYIEPLFGHKQIKEIMCVYFRENKFCRFLGGEFSKMNSMGRRSGSAINHRREGLQLAINEVEVLSFHNLYICKHYY